MADNMQPFEHNGVIYQPLPNGKVKPIGYSNPLAGATPVGGPDPTKPLDITGKQLSNARAQQELNQAPVQQQGQVLSNEKTAQQIKIDRFSTLTDLKKQFDADKRVQAFRDVLPQVNGAMAAPDTAQGDLSIVYSFGKVMDPGSAVRGEEMDMARGSSPLLGQLQSLIGMVQSGKRLPPQTRRGLVDAMRQRGIQYAAEYQQARDEFKGLATEGGYDPLKVIGHHAGEKFAKIEANYTGRPVINGDGSIAARPERMSPTQLDSVLRDMFRRQVPVADIRKQLADVGSTLPPEQEAILNQYEQARLSGQPTQVGVRTLPPEGDIGRSIAAGGIHVWDRAAEGLQNLSNMTGLTNDQSATQAAQQHQNYFNQVQINPTGDFMGRALAAGVATAPLGGPLTQGALGGMLAGDSRDSGGLTTDAALGAAGGKIADLGLRGAAGLIAPEGREAMKRLAAEGVRFSPGQMIGGKARALEDRLTANPVLGPVIDSIRDRGLNAANRIPANRALGAIGQSLPESVPAGHEAVAYTRNALGDSYENALAGQQIGLDQTYVNRLNTLGMRSQMRPDEFNKAADIIQREVGGAFQGPTLGSMSGRTYKKLDSRLGRLSTDFRRSTNPFDRDIGDLLGDVKDQTRALARRQSPDMGNALRATDEGYANFKILERAAASNPATGIFTPGQLRTAIKASDRSVGKGATARGEALMQGLASDMSEALPSTVGSSGTSEREQVNKLAPWVLGALLRPAYSEPAEQIIARALLRDPGLPSQITANTIRSLPRGMFGGLAPGLVYSGQ